jgi:hypothetical protein
MQQYNYAPQAQYAPMQMVPMPDQYANYSMPPQDDIAAIKMRNRRFAQDGGYQMGMPQQHM